MKYEIQHKRQEVKVREAMLALNSLSRNLIGRLMTVVSQTNIPYLIYCLCVKQTLNKS